MEENSVTPADYKSFRASVLEGRDIEKLSYRELYKRVQDCLAPIPDAKVSAKAKASWRKAIEDEMKTAKACFKKGEPMTLDPESFLKEPTVTTKPKQSATSTAKNSESPTVSSTISINIKIDVEAERLLQFIELLADAYAELDEAVKNSQ